MKKYIYILFSLLVVEISYAQDLSMDYYSYLYNWYNINPAFSSKDDKMAAILNIRQRAGVNYNNSMIGLKGLSGENQGLGGRIISDTRGAFQVLKMDATYGYMIKINEKSALHFGLSAGIVNKSFNVSRIKNYENLDQTDPILQTSNLKTNSFLAGTGFVYDFKDFEFSASSPSLIESGQKMSKNFLLMANNKFYVTKDLHLTPIVFYFNMPVVKSYGGFQLKTDYKNLVWLQTGYQTSETFNVGIGCIFGVLSVGYNYSTANKVLSNQSSGTHEVLLRLKINSEKHNPTVVTTASAPSESTKAESSNDKLNTIITRLDKILQAPKNDKEAIRKEIESLKNDLSNLLQKNLNSSNQEDISKNLDIIEKKIKELELQLEK